MVRHSVIESERWESRRSSLPRDHPGRIPTSSVSSARSAVNAWITLSSSTSVTCAAYCRAIFNIIMTPERISRSTRTAHGLVACNFPPQAILLPSPRSAVCIIAMSVEPREIGEATRSACPHSIALNSFLSKDSRGHATSQYRHLSLPLSAYGFLLVVDGRCSARERRAGTGSPFEFVMALPLRLPGCWPGSKPPTS